MTGVSHPSSRSDVRWKGSPINWTKSVRRSQEEEWIKQGEEEIRDKKKGMKAETKKKTLQFTLPFFHLNRVSHVLRLCLHLMDPKTSRSQNPCKTKQKKNHSILQILFWSFVTDSVHQANKLFGSLIWSYLCDDLSKFCAHKAYGISHGMLRANTRGFLSTCSLG